MSRITMCFSLLVYQLLIVVVKCEWNCPPESKFCFYLFNSTGITWDEARSKCSGLGGDLPGAEHMNERTAFLKRGNTGPFWTSLCFTQGRLQWLGSNPYEERNLPFIDKLLPDLTSRSIVPDQLYCFYATYGWPDDALGNNFKLALKNADHDSKWICAVDRRDLHRLAAPPTQGKVTSASILSLGTDIDWGPIGQERDGFINLPSSRHKSLKLRCDVQPTESQEIVNYHWLRNGGYMGVNAQEIGFTSEDDLMSWVGSVTCEATSGAQFEPVRSENFHLTIWDTVTVRITTNCVTCQLQGVVESSKIILTQFVENEIRPGAGQEMEYYSQPPVINRTSVSVILHLRNKRIDKFDYKMAQKFGPQFDLSGWAKRRSLLLPNGSDLRLELINPCNMALPQDRQNVSWIGYLGQVVSSGNIIDGPICVDRQGDLITRSCGLTNSFVRYQECAAVKPRQEEPICFPGFEYSDGRCWRATEEATFTAALTQCSAGRRIPQQHSPQESVPDWIQNAIRWFGRHRSTEAALPVVWMPLRRFGQDSALQPIVWNWKTGSNRWLLGDTWNATEQIDYTLDDQSCAAFNLETKQLVIESCQKELPAICSRPALPQPISVIVRNQFDYVGEYFCPPGWITHLLVSHDSVCYRQLTLREPVTWDDAERMCLTQGGNLASAPTNALRIVLEHVHSFYNNATAIESWIGLRSRRGQTGAFTWVNQSPDQRAETYSWDPYNEFGDGYGVSMGIGHKWKTWPHSVKLSGLICQKTVSDWRDSLRLRLEPSSGPAREGNYSLIFTYDPPPVRLIGEAQLNQLDRTYERVELPNMKHNFVKKFFWLSDFDVLCYFANEVLHFLIPAGYHRRYQTSLNVPDNVGPSTLTCEGWLNNPATRFLTNTVLHRPSNSYAFVLIVAKQSSGFSRSTSFQPFVNPRRLESNEDDLRRRLSLNSQSRLLRDVISRAFIAAAVKSEMAYDIQLIHYKLSFSLPPNVHQLDVKNDIRGCQTGPAEMYIANQFSDSDLEPLLHLLLKSCLPSLYQQGDNYQLVEIRSTAACPAESPFALPDQIQRPHLQVHHLSWPRTKIGQFTRPQQLCTVDDQVIVRTCQGNLETGAIWGPVEMREVDEVVDESRSCDDPNAASARLSSLERVVRNTDPESVLDELLADWGNKKGTIAKLETTINILKQIVNEVKASRGSLGRLIVKIGAVIDKVVYPGASPLEELQYQPALLTDFVNLLAEVPVLDMRSNRVEWRFGQEVTTAAERTDFGSWRTNTQYPPTFLDLERVSVNITKDFGNFGYKPSLMAIATTLPSALLTLDPATKTHTLKVHKSDASDPKRAVLLGSYIADVTTVRVELLTEPKTTHLTSPLTLAFKPTSDEGAIDEEAAGIVCARWEARLGSSNNGGWLTDGCWYLGQDNSASAICQCNSPGIFGVFYPQSAYYAKLRSVLHHRLPVIVNVALFVVIFVVAIVRACFVFRKAVQEMDLVEMGVRLELIAAWTGMLIFYLSQTFLTDHTVSCAVLTTMTQFFFFAAFLWLCMLFILRHMQIREHWIRYQGAFLVKISFAIWALASIVVLTIPIYKWKHLSEHVSSGYGCWFEHEVDFGLTVGIVIVGLLIALIIQTKNICDQRDSIEKQILWTDGLSLFHIMLMGTAGLLAVINNSWYHSIFVAIAFGTFSGILGIWWIVLFWLQVPSPVVKHDFRSPARQLSLDLQLKKVYGSSVEYLAHQ